MNPAPVKAAILMIPVMSVVHYLLHQKFNLDAAPLIAISIYWFGFLLPASIHTIGVQGLVAELTPRWPGWPSLILLISATLVQGIWAATLDINLPVAIVGGVFVAALINGTLEELFWRGALFSGTSKPEAKAMISGWVLFTLWHFAIIASGEVTVIDGVKLISGAAVLGAVWSFARYRSGNAGIGAFGHVAVNFLLFAEMAAMAGRTGQ